MLMRFVSFISYLPWTILGILCALMSGPARLRLFWQPLSIVFDVKSFWWYRWLPANKGVRAVNIGHATLLGPQADAKDLAHELIHVEQHERVPLIYPLLYTYRTWKYGYRQNPYEQEAYKKSGSRYIE